MNLQTNTGSPHRNKAKFIRPPNHLKQKAGYGGIPEERIQKAQKIIEENTEDFAPYAWAQLKRLKENLKSFSQSESSAQDLKTQITDAIMQIKANAGMFRHSEVGNIAARALHSIENIEDLNTNACELLTAYANAIDIALRQNWGDAPPNISKEIMRELDAAYERYKARHVESMASA